MYISGGFCFEQNHSPHLLDSFGVEISNLNKNNKRSLSGIAWTYCLLHVKWTDSLQYALWENECKPWEAIEFGVWIWLVAPSFGCFLPDLSNYKPEVSARGIFNFLIKKKEWQVNFNKSNKRP